MIFTVEEMHLMQAFDHSTRGRAIIEIMGTLPDIRDTDLKDACRKTLDKLSKMTDEEYLKVDFTVYGGDDDE